MNPEDLGKIFEQAQQLQTRLQDVQKEVAKLTVEVSSGGGMVTVVARGDLRIAEIRIEPSLLESGDLGMIQDLTAAAVNAALTKAQEMAQAEIQRASGLPPGFPGIDS